ncbi:MAG: argininosuccinate synthase [Planctomycetota bacterium]
MSASPRLLLAYSGGLDTSYLVAWLTREKGYDVTTLTVDCGGFTAGDHAALEDRARTFGATLHRVVDARGQLFERVLRWLIAGNVRRGGTYPISVAAERGLQAEVLATVAREQRFDVVAHGCTGAGNDQVRFEAALSVVAEGLEVLAPVRDLAPSREDEIAYLEGAGLAAPGGKRAAYSVNAGLWGLTIGGRETLTSDQPLPEEAWNWTRGGGGEAVVYVRFERGVPVALDLGDGETLLEPVALIEALNEFAGKHGVGRGYHLGDTVLGIKGRIGYEAPAAEVLLTAHRELEKLVLVEEQRFWKDQLGEVYGKRLHQGMLHDPFLRDIEALFASSQARVSGVVRVALASGRALVEGVDSPFSLMAASSAAYGERPADDASPEGALQLARVLAEPARLARRAAEAGGLAAADGATSSPLLRESQGTSLSLEEVAT